MHNQKYIINDSTGSHILTLEYKYLPDTKDISKMIAIIEKHGFEIVFGLSTDTDLFIQRIESVEEAQSDKQSRDNLIAFTNELNTYFLSLDSIMFVVAWKQHDEDGEPSQNREENIYAYSEKEAWKKAFCEGEHENDYLVSIDGVDAKELKRQGKI
ncbi:MAG: hypothetical protein IT215_01150 [Chitinophagaceae bacterium]|nr:hypothetical protein [Chitinophagaceae bacterium]